MRPVADVVPSRLGLARVNEGASGGRQVVAHQRLERSRLRVDRGGELGVVRLHQGDAPVLDRVGDLLLQRVGGIGGHHRRGGHARAALGVAVLPGSVQVRGSGGVVDPVHELLRDESVAALGGEMVSALGDEREAGRRAVDEERDDVQVQEVEDDALERGVVLR